MAALLVEMGHPARADRLLAEASGHGRSNLTRALRAEMELRRGESLLQTGHALSGAARVAGAFGRAPTYTLSRLGKWVGDRFDAPARGKA